MHSVSKSTSYSAAFGVLTKKSRLQDQSISCLAAALINPVGFSMPSSSPDRQ